MMTMRTIALAAAACGACLGLAAQAQTPPAKPAPAKPAAAAKVWTAPRTPWGEPDLRGTWPVGHLTGIPLQRPERFGERALLNDQEVAERLARNQALSKRYENEDSQDRLGMGHWSEAGIGAEANRLTSLIVSPANGRIPPLTEAGKQYAAATRSSWHQGQTYDRVTDFDTWDRCITRGFSASMLPYMYNNGIRIFQAPGVVAIQLEMVHETRIIPTDGRAGVPSQIENWMGESRGRWEGGVLVVETTNVKAGAPATNERPALTTVDAKARIVERFIPTGPDTLTYEMTVDDPTLYTAPWTLRMPWRRDDKYELFEYDCHEGNVQIRNYVTASRAARAAKAK